MELKIIEYDSEDYREMVNLRNRILREPLELAFSEEELTKDRNSLLLVASCLQRGRIKACCILTPLDESTVQLRQMAVDTFCQRKGIGSSMLDFAEQTASERKFSYLCLHAHKTAVCFYENHGYTIEGGQFIEVGIPHFGMIKYIGTNK